MLSDALPLLATLSYVIPSLRRLVSSPSLSGLSSASLVSLFVSSLGWLFYSLATGLVVSAVSSIMLLGLYVFMLYSQIAAKAALSFYLPSVLLVCMLSAFTFKGLQGLAFVLGLAPLVELAQAKVLLKRDVPALSSLAYAAVFVRTLPWVPYAIRESDTALVLWVVSSVFTSSLLFTLLVLRRVKSQLPS